MRLLCCSIALALAASGCAPSLPRHIAAPTAPAAPQGKAAGAHVAVEVALLRAALIREVPDVVATTPEIESSWIANAKAMIATSSLTIGRPQLLVVVDRNPAVQQMRIVLARPDGPWQSLGGTKVSTGQADRRGYYLTPTGVFLHTDQIHDWRAEGTFNAQHIRGLGLKGMRVWDFGWQRAMRGWGPPGQEDDIRLLLHATDPDYLEQRLGRTASKGCVRIPAAMNRFLDRYGVLDADYERDARVDGRFGDLLLPDRTPTPLAGDALVVVDSSHAANTGPISAAPAPVGRASQVCG